MKRLLLTGAALLAMASSAFATPVIDVGTKQLLADTPNQIVAIPVHGGDQVSGMNLNVQIADGGPGAGGTVAGPTISGAELVTGTIFQGNANPPQIVPAAPQVLTATVTTAAGTVAAEGTLAFVTLDTTGYTSGSWPLMLAGTLNGDTDFAGTPAQITNGTVSIVPEPASLGLLGLGGLLLARRRRMA